MHDRYLYNVGIVTGDDSYVAPVWAGFPACVLSDLLHRRQSSRMPKQLGDRPDEALLSFGKAAMRYALLITELLIGETLLYSCNSS